MTSPPPGPNSVNVSTIAGQRAEIDVSGASHLDARVVDGRKIVVNVSGARQVRAEEIRADTLEVTATGAGRFVAAWAARSRMLVRNRSRR